MLQSKTFIDKEARIVYHNQYVAWLNKKLRQILELESTDQTFSNEIKEDNNPVKIDCF